MAKKQSNKIFIDETIGKPKTQKQRDRIEQAKRIFKTIKTDDYFMVKVTDDDIIIEMA